MWCTYYVVVYDSLIAVLNIVSLFWPGAASDRVLQLVRDDSALPGFDPVPHRPNGRHHEVHHRNERDGIPALRIQRVHRMGKQLFLFTVFIGWVNSFSCSRDV